MQILKEGHVDIIPKQLKLAIATNQYDVIEDYISKYFDKVSDGHKIIYLATDRQTIIDKKILTFICNNIPIHYGQNNRIHIGEKFIIKYVPPRDLGLVGQYSIEKR